MPASQSPTQQHPRQTASTEDVLDFHHEAPVSSEEDAPNTPAKSTPPVAPSAQYADDDLVCVSFGFGAHDHASQPFYVGASVDGEKNSEGKPTKRATTVTFSRDRIARGVSYEVARSIQRAYPKAARIHPNDASEAEIARQCGVRPAEPSKVAAMLLASDLDAIAAQISPDELELLARKLRDLSIQRNAKNG